MAEVNKKRTRKATIGDVARIAGVSVTTVSRVLNKEPHVRENKRIAVAEAVSKLQYSPSMHARSLAAGRSKQIALAFYDPRGDYVSGLLQGALKKCEAEGLHLLVEQLRDDNSASRLDAFLKQFKLDGIILAPPVHEDLLVLATLAKHEVPTLLIAPSRSNPGTIGVSIDDYSAAFEITEHLINYGHNRIGFILGQELHAATRERFRGYKDALSKHAINFDETLVAQGDFQYESAIPCAETLLSLSDRPTAIFASNDDMAAGVMAVAHKKGISLPDELSIAGFDDVSIARMLWPPLTTIRQPVIEMAETAVECIIAINTPKKQGENDTPMDDIILDYEFIPRDSTKPTHD